MGVNAPLMCFRLHEKIMVYLKKKVKKVCC
jgi:hypothetical protein